MSQIGIGQSPAKIQLNFNKSIWQSGHWALKNSLKPISEQQCKGEITEWILSHPFLALARHTPDYAVSHLQVKHSRLIFLAELPHNQTGARSDTRQAAVATLPPQQQPARVKLQPREHRLPLTGTGLFFPIIYFHVLPASTLAILQSQHKSGQLAHPTVLAWKEFGLSS